MLTFYDFQKIYGGKTVGETLKDQADLVMTETWDNDISTRTAYLYDWYHDTHKTQLVNMQPKKDKNKVAISIKYLAYSGQTYAKDFVTYHLQLKPGQQCNVNYYDEFFGKKYSTTFPEGLYVDIPDADGVYNRWLVVGLANINDPQFPTFEILKCNYIFRWITNGKKTLMAGVLRSQNS